MQAVVMRNRTKFAKKKTMGLFIGNTELVNKLVISVRCKQSQTYFYFDSKSQSIEMHDLLINVAKEDDVVQIVHLLIDHLLELPKSALTRSKLASALKIVNASSEDLTVTLRLLDNLIRQYCLGEINESELKSHFSNLSSSMQTALVHSVELRKPEICQFLVNEINSKDNLLMESFDWDVKWIMGNSSLASTREQIATVMLNCRDKDQKLKTVRFEMNRERLADMIEVLEKCDGMDVDK